MTLVVLAAGMGSRYGGLKQMDPIGPNGEFIIDYSVYDAVRAGYDKVVFIIKKENYDAFRATIGKRIESIIDVQYAFQTMEHPADVPVPADRVKPFGTAHALMSCRGLVKESFAVINADDYYGSKAYELAAAYMQSPDNTDKKLHYCMVGYRLENTLTENGTVSRGIVLKDKLGMLAEITERTKIRRCDSGAEYYDDATDSWVGLAIDSIASMNFFGFGPDILDYVAEGFDKFLRTPGTDLLKGEYYLPAAAGKMVADGLCDLKVLETADKWYGVTYHEDREKVVNGLRSLTESGLYPQNLWLK